MQTTTMPTTITIMQRERKRRKASLCRFILFLLLPLRPAKRPSATSGRTTKASTFGKECRNTGKVIGAKSWNRTSSTLRGPTSASRTDGEQWSNPDWTSKSLENFKVDVKIVRELLD